MWNELANWWMSLWAEPKVFGPAVGALITGLVIFILGETWKHRRLRRDMAQGRLDEVYGPLYIFYREAYARFEAWKAENPQSQIERRPFFSEDGNERFVEEILTKKASHASHNLIVLWTHFQAAASADKQRRRESFIMTLIREYQTLRRNLGLDHNKRELRSGEFEDQRGAG